MEIHRSGPIEDRAFLFLDSDERIVELPTDFLRHLANFTKKLAPKTLELYATRIRDFCTFLADHQVYGQVRIDDALKAVGLPIIDEFYKNRQDFGLEPPTVRLYEVVLKRFTDWLSTEGAGRVHERPLYANITYRTPSPKKRIPRYLTAVQIIALILEMQWEVQRLVTHFIFDTGVRVSEVPRVLNSDLPKVEDYPADDMYFPLFIRGSKGRGRQIKERYTIISRPMLVRMNRYFKSRTYFTNHEWSDKTKPAFLNIYGEKLTKSAIQKFIADAAKRSDLVGSASSHKIRHSTSYSVLRSDHGKSTTDNLVILQNMLGHGNISTTEMYTHIPAPALQQINIRNGAPESRKRFEEAERILDETYLPEKKQRKVRRIGTSDTAHKETS